MTPQPPTNKVIKTPDEASGGVTEKIGFKDLFFIRRLPKLGFPREYQRPADAESYRKRLIRSGFITLEDIARHNKDNGLPEGALKRLRADAQFMLEEPISQIADASFVDRLYQFDHDALYYQNSYYWFNWVFIIGAFITTIMSVIGVLSPRFDPSGTLGGFAWLITAVCGVITAAASALNQSRRPQLRWFVNRRKAEAMRRHYYLFITRAEPYSGEPAARRTKLAEVITQIENIGSSLNMDEAQKTASVLPEVQPIPVEKRLSQDELEFLTYIYRERRLQAQTTWYRNRKQEFEYNSNFAMLISALFVSAVGLIGALSAQLTDNFIIQLLPTALPALAAALAAFHQVYGWDRQQRVYDDTVAQLRGASAKLTYGEGPDRKSYFVETIQACEQVFASESDQWGQGLIDQEMASFTAQTAESQINTLIEQSSLPLDTKQQMRAILESVAASRPNAPPLPPPGN